jgi:hypothetical protein
MTGTDLRETKTEHRAIPTILKIYNCSSKASPSHETCGDQKLSDRCLVQRRRFRSDRYVQDFFVCSRNCLSHKNLLYNNVLAKSSSLSLSRKFSLRYRQIFFSRRGGLIRDKSNKHKSGEKQTRAVGSTIVQVRCHKVFGAWRN